ncbi:MAG: D-glycero-alpha-D-manno-heptose-1,7-bisphosphate 7-phosphatase [Myxococcota bacterium]
MACQKHLSEAKGSDKGTAATQVSRRGAPEVSGGPRAAIFLDRDGTLIEEREYLSDPEQLALIPGTAEALVALREAGFALVCVTNQSAIGRGWLTSSTLAHIHDALERDLAEQGAWLDAIYFCPDVDAETSAEADRKPGSGMLLRAAKELDLTLAESWIVGDHLRDLEAGLNADCRAGILVLTGHGERFSEAVSSNDIVCKDLAEAAQRILATDRH